MTNGILRLGQAEPVAQSHPEESDLGTFPLDQALVPPLSTCVSLSRLLDPSAGPLWKVRRVSPSRPGQCEFLQKLGASWEHLVTTATTVIRITRMFEVQALYLCKSLEPPPPGRNYLIPILQMRSLQHCRKESLGGTIIVSSANPGPIMSRQAAPLIRPVSTGILRPREGSAH